MDDATIRHSRTVGVDTIEMVINRRRAIPMVQRSASWWVWTLAASFGAYFILLVYCDIVRPQAYGYRGRFIGGRMVISSVVSDPNTPAARAGLVAGDVIVTADARHLADSTDWTIVEANLELGRPIGLIVERDGRRLERALVLSQADRRYWTTGPGAVLLIALVVQGVALGVALLIAWTRSDDPVALLGAWALCAVSVYTIVPPYRFASVWRGLPEGIGLLMWPAYLSSRAVPAVLFTFFASFPRRMIHSSRLWTVVWTPIAVVVAYQLYAAWLLIYRPTRAVGTPAAPLELALSGAYLLSGAAMLVFNYRRLTDANERRRLVILVVGAVAGLLPGLTAISTSRFHADADVAGSIFASRLTSLGTIGLLLFPSSLAYAVLRHRVFDVRLIVRQSVRYAIARGALLSLVPLLAFVLALDVFTRDNQPLAVALKTRASMYVVVAGLAVAAHWQRQRWLERLDRRFFREQYDAGRVLRRVADDIRDVSDFTSVAPRVVAHIEAALHPEWVAWLVRARSDVTYRTLVSTPAGLAPPPLRVDTTLVALLRVFAKPFQVSSGTAAWLTPQLSRADLEWVEQGRAELLVPVGTNGEHAESVLILGSKRSEEPYTQDDCDLLTVLATNLSLLFERPEPAASAVSPLVGECPQCGVCDDASAQRCRHDGASLVPRSLPRLFAARYRIDRRLGSGGFGAVYEAFDLALDRRVAIKTIRDDLLTEASVATRFQREARLAAGFVHANVVTVHDFGIDSCGRAFLVMELLEGTTLREALARETRFSPSRVLAIMADVCAAMSAAHGRNLVHRDLKPENIFLVNGGPHHTAKILDFGITLALNDAREEVNDEGTMAGSLRYMAPAQLRGDDAEPSSDVWALGIIAYEMLTGSHPFAGTSPADLSTLPMDPLVALAGPLAGAPEAWMACFQRLLALDGTVRPATPATLLRELEWALVGVAA